MDSVLLITISAFILAVILIIVTIVIIKRNQNKKYKKEIEELDIRKNNLIGVPVLSEITKVKELIKTDNLKNKLDDWDNTFTTIRDEKIPELTDLISEADFLIDRKDYKQAVKKITNIEIEINSLKKKTDHLLEEVKLITNSEERNRALITKLKIVYREDQNKFERSKKPSKGMEKTRGLKLVPCNTAICNSPPSLICKNKSEILFFCTSLIGAKTKRDGGRICPRKEYS